MTSATAKFLTQAEASAAASALEGGDLVVVDKRSEIIEEAPPPPYNTAALLEDATARLKWEAAKVMRVAQSLFEGIELYGGGGASSTISLRFSTTTRSPPSTELAAALASVCVWNSAVALVIGQLLPAR